MSSLFFEKITTAPTPAIDGNAISKIESSNSSTWEASPSVAYSDSQDITPSWEGTGLLAYIFATVVPFLAITSFLLVKLHDRIHGKPRSKKDGPSISKQRDQDVYNQWKPELAVDQGRFEMHGDDLRYEKPDTDEVKELPGQTGELKAPDRQYPCEVAGEHCSCELEISR